MTSDSLNLLAYQSGLVATPLQEQAASAARDLCTEQQLMRIGDPLPLVFCRRVGDVGGVLVSPPATEARFENNATNVLTASWHLVVSEGPIDPIEVRDVFQCACRVGNSTQSFSRRAGNWSPGNVTVDRGGTYKRWDVPRFCGAAGTFNNLHTLSFVNTYADGEEWNRAVHAFIRGGRHVTRLVDGVIGPSNNVVDLYLLLLRKVERIPENLIDLDNLRHAARFTEALGMRFDGNFSGEATQNLDDWRENVLKPYFLLQATRINGREGLMPLLPTNRDGSLYTGVVGPHATLTELDLDLSTWDLQFLSLADRRPIRAQMMWRQQADGIDSIVRTSEVYFRPPHDAPDGPFEQHDLSEFACSERHIAKVGAYLVAHRALVTHTLKVDAIPGDYNSSVSDGMIVRVTVPRTVDGQTTSTHDYLYRVVSIEKDLGGTTVFNLVHFPLDTQGRSAVAMAVLSANPSGLVLPIAKTGPVCDVNSSTDTTSLPDNGIPWNLPTDPTFGIPIDPPFDPIDPIDPPIPPNPPMQPMPPDPPDRPMPPDPPGPDGPPGDPLGDPSGNPPGGEPNEQQPNPDDPFDPRNLPPGCVYVYDPKTDGYGVKCTPPPGQPTTSGSRDYFPWDKTPFEWENAQIDLKYVIITEDLDTFASNTVPGVVEQGQLLSKGSKKTAGPFAWSGQGYGFRTFPAGTIAVQKFLGNYPTPFALVQYYGFYVLRHQPRTTPSGTQYTETAEVVVAQMPIDIGDKSAFNPTIFGTFYWNNTVTTRIEIIELKLNGVPQTPPVFTQNTTRPGY